MFSSVKNFLYSKLRDKNFISDEEIGRYVLIFAICIVALSVHLLFGVFFMFFCLPLGFFHFFGVVVLLVAILLTGKKRYDISILLISLTINTSSVLTMILLPSGNYSILYQVLMLVFLIISPFSNRKMAITSHVLMPIIMISSHFAGEYIPPYVSGEEVDIYNKVLTIMNIAINSVGYISIFALEKMTRSFADKYRQKQLEELKSQAYIDELTGLYNRRYANLFLDYYCSGKKSENYCVAMLDLDDFKKVNDDYGHDAGDQVLRMVADHLRKSLRKTDKVFRWGGEEFVIIIKEDSLSNVYAVMENLRALIENSPVLYEDKNIYITFTAGVEKFIQGDFVQTLKFCDKKLYEGKQKGKNVIIG